MPIPFGEVFAGPELRTRFADTALVAAYQDGGSPAGELIYLGFGETWTQVAPGLAASLAAVPRHAHGYVISQYGLPRLQRVLRSYLTSAHRLGTVAEAGRDYEVAVSGGGTRNAMFDFARLLRATMSGESPVAIAPMPGWDYAGILEPLGYRMRYLRADGEPDPAELAGLLDGPDPLLVVNAQHNPTGTNWSATAVRSLVRQAMTAGAAILLDDAYYGVHDPAMAPTSALRVLLEELRDAPPVQRGRWLAVRSLGKQFHCNGWGIGSVTADPRTLDTLVNKVQFARTFAAAIPLQEAMASWLEDPRAADFLAETGRGYTRKRDAVREWAVGGLGYPEDAVRLGECGPFARLRIPPSYGDDVAGFRSECLRRTGVLLGVDRWTATPTGEPAYFRIFLGPEAAVIAEALERLRKAGYVYV